MNRILESVADELRGTMPAQLDLTIGDHLDQLHSAADRVDRVARAVICVDAREQVA